MRGHSAGKTIHVMQSTFLHPIFTQLSKTDWRQLQKFVASPYFNGRLQLIPLVEYFSEIYLKKEEPVIETAFQKAFPKKGIDDQLWRLTISQLYKLTEEWLAVQKTKKERPYYQLPLAHAYRSANLEGHYLRTTNAFQKKLNKETEKDAEFYEDLYQLEWEKYRFLSTGKRTEALNLQEVSDKMDVAFIARKLRIACFAISHEAVFKTEYEIGLLQSILAHLHRSPQIVALPAIGLYYYCYLSLTENDERHFQTFTQSLSQNAATLPKDEQRNLYLLAINFGIRQINASRPEYDRPVLELYQMALQKDLLLENGRLSHFAFNNIVAIAIRKNENEWVEQFMGDYETTLERRYRNVSYSLGMARLEHARKNYGAALLHLQNADYKDFINNIIAKTLQMKIYFETKEYEVLEPHLRNMRTYINRQRAFGYHRDNYLNIIRFMQALMELNPFDKKAKEELKKEIEAVERLTEREWLLKMLS